MRMLHLFVDNPWLALSALIAGVIVACVAIGVITNYLRQSHQADIDASLKRDMLDRGMSAVDIKTVLEARSDGEALRMALSENQAVRVGLGKFKVEVGAVHQPDSATPAAPAAHG
jgi:hypothetical protein